MGLGGEQFLLKGVTISLAIRRTYHTGSPVMIFICFLPELIFDGNPSLYMSGNKMNGSFAATRLNNFELLHGANYFSDKKNEM